jgi:2-polyprenyl-3-methyl-5-hydroxy-6-metoxy-1,4-benzoquinol methylase
MIKTNLTCWVCGHREFELFKNSDINGELNSKNFAITNFDYGKTGELNTCKNCGFIQCSDLDKVVGFYENLEDQGYEDSRKERKLQEKRLVKYLGKYKKSGKLLDIGAGSGIMVEAALEAGYDATGIEPSKWLQQQAQKHNLPVLQGVFPHPEARGPYDVIAFVDVIEHVTNPGEILAQIYHALDQDGILILVTPDVSSLAARFLKFKWWHFRIAHIGYFNQKNLVQLLNRNGFEVIRLSRPSWYFTLKYLGIRFLSFFPKFMQIPLPVFLDKIIVPVNLRDSILVVCKKKIND